MQIESIRVQNFRCVHDSGNVLLTSDLTILIGENESGKTSVLDALSCFNIGKEFSNSDLSTMSPERESVLSGVIEKGTVDVVSVTVKLLENERQQFNIPMSVLPGDLLRITKRFDNSYIIKGPNGTPLADLYTNIKNNGLLNAIAGIRRQLGSVYQGSIIRKFPTDQFVFLQRSETEPDSANLILFPSDAGEVWDDLRQGDVVQVTQQASDPFGRNVRAMNVGKVVDFEDELSQVEAAASLDADDLNASVRHLLKRIEQIPANHPLRSIFNDDLKVLLKEQIQANSDQMPWNDDDILNDLPIFERSVSSAIHDTLSLGSPDQHVSSGERFGGLQALISKVGLEPTEAVVAEPTERVRIFDEKSKQLSKIFTDAWIRDVDAEFVPFNQDKELGLAISCQGSLDPPSRRSQGFNSYLGLIASLLELERRTDGKLVLLLDDPGMHLHPIAQEKLADVLGQQQFQVITATHFPFMISPDRLDRVRLISRTETGAYLEEDWDQAGDGLLPVRGSLSRWTLGRIPVLVEGPSDRTVLLEMSALLKKSGKDSMLPIIEPLPSGGSTMPQAAKALRAMNVKFIAVVDGDRQGDDIKRRLMRDVNQPEAGIISLRDVVSGTCSPAIENLFSQALRDSKIWASQKLIGLLKSLTDGQISLDIESEDHLNLLFNMINEALETELERA